MALVVKSCKLEVLKTPDVTPEEREFLDACRKRDFEEASRYLGRIDVDCCNDDELSALMTAVGRKDEYGATWLLNAGANPNFRAPSGVTVFDVLVGTRSSHLVRMLVRHGMRMELRGVIEEPLNAMEFCGGEELVTEMFRSGIEIQPLIFCPRNYILPPIMDNMESLFLNNYKFPETIKVLLLCAHKKDPNSPLYKDNMALDTFKLFYRDCVMAWRRHEWVKIVGK